MVIWSIRPSRRGLGVGWCGWARFEEQPLFYIFVDTVLRHHGNSVQKVSDRRGTKIFAVPTVLLCSDQKTTQNDRKAILRISVDARWAIFSRTAKKRKKVRKNFFLTNKKKIWSRFPSIFSRSAQVCPSGIDRNAQNWLAVILRDFVI